MDLDDLLCVCAFASLQVWFRRGVNSHNPCGSGWISIGGEMMMVDVGLHDQVVKCFADMRVSPPSVTLV